MNNFIKFVIGVAFVTAVSVFADDSILVPQQTNNKVTWSKVTTTNGVVTLSGNLSPNYSLVYHNQTVRLAANRSFKISIPNNLTQSQKNVVKLVLIDNSGHVHRELYTLK
jgi:hypothetical protein